MSIVKYLDLPPAFTASLLTLTLLLMLSPYLAGANFGTFRMPQLTQHGKRILQYLGPVLFALSLSIFMPLPWLADDVTPDGKRLSRSVSFKEGTTFESASLEVAQLLNVTVTFSQACPDNLKDAKMINRKLIVDDVESALERLRHQVEIESNRYRIEKKGAIYEINCPP